MSPPRAKAASRLVVCVEGHTFDHGGAPVNIGPGSIVLEGSPLVAGRQQFYRPLVLIVDYADLSAGAEALVPLVNADEAVGYHLLPVKLRTGSKAPATVFNLGPGG